MSLFRCEECGCVENTACSGYWFRKRQDDPRALCSQCDPEIGRWHGMFERVAPAPSQQEGDDEWEPVIQDVAAQQEETGTRELGPDDSLAWGIFGPEGMRRVVVGPSVDLDRLADDEHARAVTGREIAAWGIPARESCVRCGRVAAACACSRQDANLVAASLSLPSGDGERATAERAIDTFVAGLSHGANGPEFTRDAANASPPYALNDDAQRVWLLGRDATIEHVREDFQAHVVGRREDAVDIAEERERLAMFEMEASERAEVQGELLDRMETLGFDIERHDGKDPCFTCSLSKMLERLSPAPSSGETRDGETSEGLRMLERAVRAERLLRDLAEDTLRGPDAEAFKAGSWQDIEQALDDADGWAVVDAAIREFAKKHDVFADPVGGGWDGFQAACHDCSWRGTRVWKDKTAACIEAQSHHSPVASGESAEPDECPHGVGPAGGLCKRCIAEEDLTPASAVPVDGDERTRELLGETAREAGPRANEAALGVLMDAFDQDVSSFVVAGQDVAPTAIVTAVLIKAMPSAIGVALGTLVNDLAARLSSTTKGDGDGD